MRLLTEFHTYIYTAQVTALKSEWYYPSCVFSALNYILSWPQIDLAITKGDLHLYCHNLLFKHYRELHSWTFKMPE